MFKEDVEDAKEDNLDGGTGDASEGSADAKLTGGVGALKEGGDLGPLGEDGGGGEASIDHAVSGAAEERRRSRLPQAARADIMVHRRNFKNTRYVLVNYTLFFVNLVSG